MISDARTYEEFMAEAKRKDPERFALVAHRYPVLSDRQMERRAKREIPFSQLRGAVGSRGGRGRGGLARSEDMEEAA